MCLEGEKTNCKSLCSLRKTVYGYNSQVKAAHEKPEALATSCH